MNINEMTYRQFMSLPYRKKWSENIECDSLVILPMKVNQLKLLLYKIHEYLADKFSFIKEPEIFSVPGMHESGYRLMDFVAVKGGEPVCLLSGCSDVIHFDGIGGFGYGWLEKHNGIPKLIPPSGWNIDCLPKSGLLSIWTRNGRILCGPALSSFEIFTLEDDEIVENS
jgi:hypothetical protein